MHHARPTASTISIHALLAESDNTMQIVVVIVDAHFYPRSPCGERQAADISTRRDASISIHALLAESDERSLSKLPPYQLFLSTLSLRRATGQRLRISQGIAMISIHALLAESDCQWRRSVKLFRQFLSTLSLRRATIPYIYILVKTFQFLSTLSLRRATIPVIHVFVNGWISIHALLAESD